MMKKYFNIIFLVGVVFSLPRYSLQEATSCMSCHVNPTGSGMRNDYGSNIYVFRRALVKKNSTYELNDSLFNSTELVQKKLNKIKKKIINKSNKDYDNTANLIKRYGSIAFSYILIFIKQIWERIKYFNQTNYL